MCVCACTLSAHVLLCCASLSGITDSKVAVLKAPEGLLTPGRFCHGFSTWEKKYEKICFTKMLKKKIITYSTPPHPIIKTLSLLRTRMTFPSFETVPVLSLFWFLKGLGPPVLRIIPHLTFPGLSLSFRRCLITLDSQAALQVSLS